MLQLQRDTPPSTSSEPLRSRHAACCVFSSTVRTISGWFSSLLSTLQPTRHRGRPTYMSVRKVVTGQALERAGRLIDGLKSFLVFGFNRTTDHTTLRPIEWTRLVCHSGAVYHQLTGFKKTGQMIGDQSSVFSVVVCIWFQSFDWLVKVWRVDTVNRATEVKCYQFFFIIWRLRERCWFKEDNEITRSLYPTTTRSDSLNTNNIWTWADSSLENAVNTCLLTVAKTESHRPQKSASAPEHITFQTSDDPVELQLGSTGVRGTESSRLRPHQLLKLYLMSVWTETNRSGSVSDLSCERSL